MTNHIVTDRFVDISRVQGMYERMRVYASEYVLDMCMCDYLIALVS